MKSGDPNDTFYRRVGQDLLLPFRKSLAGRAAPDPEALGRDWVRTRLEKGAELSGLRDGGVDLRCLHSGNDWWSEILGLTNIDLLQIDFQAEEGDFSVVEAEALVRRWMERHLPDGPVLVMARVPVGRPLVVQALEGAGFRSLGCLLGWERHMQEIPVWTGPPVDLVPLNAEYAREVIDIIANTEVWDRFRLDPALGQEVSRKAWKRIVEAQVDIDPERCQVALCDGEVAGFLLWHRETWYTDSLGWTIIYLDLMSIRPRFRGRGIAQALFHRAYADGTEVPRTFLVGTYPCNYPAARLYEKLGFQLSRCYDSLRFVRTG